MRRQTPNLSRVRPGEGTALTQIHAAILAAGSGTRLGRAQPKPLTPLSTGETILQRQVGTLRAAFGEQISIVSRAGKPALVRRLEECADDDYFERGIEFAIEKDGLAFEPLDISGYPCVEVDFEADLVRANAMLVRR